MTDDIPRLRDALGAVPAPEPGRRAAHIAAAMAAFNESHAPNQGSTQGSAAGARRSFGRAVVGRVSEGVTRMIDHVRGRAGLALTTGLVTAGVAVLLVLPQIEPFGRGRAPQETRVESDAATVAPRPALEAEPAAPPAESRAEIAGTARKRSLASDRMALDAAPPAPAPEAMRLVDGIPRALPERADRETFERVGDSPVMRVADAPVSTFSIDVDTASYAVVRSSLISGRMPPREAVRVEEMVNYFPYDYPAPETRREPAGDAGGTPFEATVSVMPTPWNADTRLVEIALQGALPAVEARPPLNLVFLIDSSGSMQDASKLPLLKQSLRLMLGRLRDDDQVAIVTYAGSSGLVLEPTPASDRSPILGALDRLEAGGGTAGQAGLEQAYAVAAEMAGEGEVTRVLLATDGDFNVGPSDPEALKDFVERKREGGTYLSVLGFGRGNLNDALMQALAQNGNGHAAHIDTLAEAQKVLVDQLTGALFPIADDVKIQVEFNPAEVAEYRLIGYETRALAREDFNDDRVDAGEIGAGHQVTALYEVTAPGSPALLTDALRYQSDDAPAAETTSAARAGDGELGHLRLRWKAPGAEISQLIEEPIRADATAAGTEQRFAAAVAGFGQLLRGSNRLGEWGYDDAIALAKGARGPDPFGYRAEAVQLMRLAQSLTASQH